MQAKASDNKTAPAINPSALRLTDGTFIPANEHFEWKKSFFLLQSVKVLDGHCRGNEDCPEGDTVLAGHGVYYSRVSNESNKSNIIFGI